MAQWVVASYDTIEPSIPVRVMGLSTIEWIFLCEDCVKQLYPDAVYHREVVFPELPIEKKEFFNTVMPKPSLH